MPDQGALRGRVPQGELIVPLRTLESVVLPPHRAQGGFDHATVHRSADRLYVAHTANDTVEVIDLDRRVHAATLEGFPGVAGAAVSEEGSLLVCTCRGEGTVSLAALCPARTAPW